jgi:hypothetical protein
MENIKEVEENIVIKPIEEKKDIIEEKKEYVIEGVEKGRSKRRPYNKHAGAESTYIMNKPGGYQQKIGYVKKKYISPEMVKEMYELVKMGYLKCRVCEKFKITLPTLNKYIRAYVPPN